MVQLCITNMSLFYVFVCVHTGLSCGSATTTVAGTVSHKAYDATDDIRGIHRASLQDSFPLPGKLPGLPDPLLTEQSH